MDEQALKRIGDFLNEKGLCLDSLSKSKLTQLEKIDRAIQSRLSSINSAKETLKTTSVNISVISVDTGISRKTFYNNDLLKAFVERYTTYEDERTASALELERIKSKYDALQKQVNKFVLRDIETENLRHKNSELNREIQHLQERNASLEQQYEKTQKELSEANKQIAQRSKILVLNKDILV